MAPNSERKITPARQVVRVAVTPLTMTRVNALRPGQKAADGYFTAGDGRLIARARGKPRAVVREWLFKWSDRDGEPTLTIGRLPEMSLTEARRRATALRDVRAAGGDPRRHVEQAQIAREAADREKQAAGSFKQLCDAYVAKLKAEEKESAREVENALNRHVIKAFPKLAQRRASDIVPDDIVAIISKMIRAGLRRKANMVRAYLHAGFAVALKSDHDPRRAAQGRSAFRLTSNPVAVVPRQADFDTVRDRVLTDAEVKAYVLALAELRDPISCAIKCSMLLGGQRVAQLLRVTWDDYDTEAGTLRLRDPKGRGGTRDHYLPVSKRVAAALPLPHPDGGPYIFTTGAQKAIHPSSVAVAVKVIAGKICGRGPGFGAGDVRRTVETRMAALGVSKEHRAQVLSHGLTRGVQEKHYDRHLYLDEKRAALALWEAHLDTLTAPAPQPAKPEAKGRAKLRLVA
jgi:integrase